ncbi:glutathione peroxidase [Shewanella dokdonensis]|uniref:Glutathione peroxidase n=1 Tax=Shewanella dokdonensis TaxID=712036 RepID=A0ABX8DFD5_9GAMM|nr:glutathione peroxidase [Shewanella dokdonensis]MCL1073602.1 glutathione peroxidase [Shewanella dokdonensis]QVK22647.1 glutathione peroxidase [Shewanella dokdonensis]
MYNSIYDFEVTDITGNTVNLSRYKGKVLLIVNTASKCGFTPQYAGLEQLYQTYAAQGLVILGFPCNQFGSQEPGSNEQINQFCQLNYGVSFPMFAKVAVNGPDTHPLYQWLKQQAPGFLGSQAIKWNFSKFLITRDGKVAGRFAPTTKPAAIETQLSELLALK